MMREYSITTCEGSCTPQNTAEPSMAGVKNGRPAITSTIRNQSATAAAPIRPAMNPSRRIRVHCMSFNIGSLQGGASTDPAFERSYIETHVVYADTARMVHDQPIRRLG